MRILYFTTAMNENDFASYSKHWKTSLNPSNQNFHNKLIRALSITNEVIVISFRPYSKQLCDLDKLPAYEKQDGNIKWIYLKIEKSIPKKLMSLKSQLAQLLWKIDKNNTILITDTINSTVVHFANYAIKKFKYKSIGVVTDSPSNITGTKKSFTNYLLNHSSNFDAYIALTESLNELYNIHSKKSYILRGIVDRNEEQLQINQRPYIFIGGALLERYGIYQLIEGFKQIKNQDIDLLICGHHEEQRLFKEIEGYNNIKFLGLLPVKKVLEYEKNATICINPRPFSEDLDRFSIPSKTLEYLASGSITLSVRNSILQNIFPNEIIWIKNSTPDEIKKAIEKALKFTKKEREEITNNALKKVNELFSIEVINSSLDNFLKNL